MKTLVITSENNEEIRFLKNLLDKLNISVEELTEEDIEDLALLRAMVKEKKGEYVSEKEIKNVLK